MHLNLFGRRRPSTKPGSGVRNNVTRTNVQRNNGDKSSKNETIESLARMRETIRDLEKRENFLSVKAKAQHEEALSKSKAGDKQGAITAMTRKKMFEKEVLKLMQMKGNLESQMLSIESANVSMVAHEGMQVGLNAQRLVSANLNPDDVADLHQDIEDHLNSADEISNILSGSYNAGDVFDEDELLAELNDELATENGGTAPVTRAPVKKVDEEDDVQRLAKMMEAIPAVPEGRPLPVAPNAVLDDDDDEDDLKKLEREMGL